uniref:Uncharacterized protein n=1 Tax=Panagrolaimus superbus TaxID=310955 RepID=A0A914Y045_9BILA
MLNQLTSPFAAQHAGVRPPPAMNNPLSNLFATLERERLTSLSMQSPQLGMPRAPFPPQQQNLGAQSAANALQQMLRASEQQQQQPATSQSPFLSAGGLPNHAAFDLNAAAQFLPQLAQNSLMHAGNPLMRPPFHFLNNVSQAQAQNLLNMQSFGKMSFPPTQPNNNTKRDP